MSKLLYSMGEVTEMFDVNASLIRYWESKFDCLKPQKNKKGNRLFTPEDVENLKLIYHLVKEKGMTLEGANRTMKRNRHGVAHESSVLERLQKIRAMLVEVRESLKEEGTVKYEQTDEAADTAAASGRQAQELGRSRRGRQGAAGRHRGRSRRTQAPPQA